MHVAAWGDRPKVECLRCQEGIGIDTFWQESARVLDVIPIPPCRGVGSRLEYWKGYYNCVRSLQKRHVRLVDHLVVGANECGRG